MKPMDFTNRWVLITGASSGLGREMARVLAAEHSANLVLVARREDRLQELKSELESAHSISVHTVVADLSNEDEAHRMFDEATVDRPLYGVILNAGVTHFGHWDELDFDAFKQMQAINNTSVVKLIDLALPYLEGRAENGGLMIVASYTGVHPTAYQTYYSATKAFLVCLGGGLHHEMKHRGVSVTTYIPGGIVTEQTAGERFNHLRGWLMPVEKAARSAVKAFRKRHYMHIPGVLYGIGGPLMRVVPQRLFTGILASVYRRSLLRNNG